MCVLLKAHSNPLLCMVCHVATHSYMHGRVEPPCRIRWPHQHVARRLPHIDSLKNSGNRLSFASSRSRSRFRDMSWKASPLRRTLHTARRPEIVRHCSRAFALLGWMLSVAAIVLAFHVVATSARFRAPPRSPIDRSCRGVASFPIVLNQLTAQPFVDDVHSTSHGSSLICEFTDNTLHSSVHESLDEFPQTAPFLVSSATLQLRGWIPPVPPNVSTMLSNSSSSSSSGVLIESCRCGRSPREYQRHHLTVRPQTLLPRSSRTQEPQLHEVSWSATPETPETSDQRLDLRTYTWLATRRDSVCASSNPHLCLETRGVSLLCTSPVQPDRSSSRAPSWPTPWRASAPLSCLDRAVFKLCNRLLHGSHPVVCVGQLRLELQNHLLDIRV